MNAVGIDVAKGKSMVAALRPLGEVAIPPREIIHNTTALKRLGTHILALGADTRVVMEATGRYHEPVAQMLCEMGIFVTVLNPLLIKQSGGGSVRKVKSDKADALKIAKYGLDNWNDLRQHTIMDTMRQQLKLISRQYNLYMKTQVALQNNLISLLDKTFPGANKLFSSPERADGSRKWVDFVATFWHADCARGTSGKAFAGRYQKWCKRRGYHFSVSKAEEIYAAALEHFTTLSKNDHTKLLITTAASELASSLKMLVALRVEMIRIAQQLPEYDTVLAMYGVGEITAAQLMAELGDVRRFANRGSIVAFAGIDPEVNESGSYQKQSTKATKRGSPHLRRTLFQIMMAYNMHSPLDEPVYRFLDKKRAEGKPYYVYMTAAANKFLRIYHARVKECLNALDGVSEA